MSELLTAEEYLYPRGRPGGWALLAPADVRQVPARRDSRSRLGPAELVALAAERGYRVTAVVHEPRGALALVAGGHVAGLLVESFAQLGGLVEEVYAAAATPPGQRRPKILWRPS